jgi:hypothetical protein
MSGPPDCWLKLGSPTPSGAAEPGARLLPAIITQGELALAGAPPKNTRSFTTVA